MNEQVTNYINEATDEQKTIMLAVRKLLHECIPNLREEFKWSRPVFGTNKDFAYLKSSKNHVTLGFYNAEKLNDPNNLLEGTGKDMRHIKLKSKADIDTKLLKEWFKVLSTI